VPAVDFEFELSKCDGKVTRGSSGRTDVRLAQLNRGARPAPQGL
jgi:hypothetical protein